jgi:predicted DNA-binding protein (UPF0251 family)
MKQQITLTRTDSLLLPFLDAEHLDTSEILLADLLCAHAEPLINRIIRSKLHVSLSPAQGSHQNQDALEVAGDVRAQILSELRKLKADPERRPIHDFAGYVAIKTQSACADYFRDQNPQRRRLRDLLRSQLNQNERFALWEAEPRRWLCGFRTWEGNEAPVLNSDGKLPLTWDALKERSWATGKSPESVTAPELLALIFDHVGRPMDFDELLSIAAGAWNIQDHPIESYTQVPAAADDQAQQTASVETTVEERLYLQHLWREVRLLPPLQRSALLLNLRDASGGNVVFFLPHLGIASKRELAEALALSIDELARLWTELPLEDAKIAARLGVTRQQVINLRKTARERLTRRMKSFERGKQSNK